MKYLNNLTATLLLITVATLTVVAQQPDSTGLPGDNFSLSGALEMFKKSESPEQFEQLINSQDNNINNLDLNGDGDIDYIKVIDKSDGDAHAFILRAAISLNEDQDIAVIELGKEGDQEAAIQIVGDPDIYGDEVIVEPVSEKVSSAPVAASPVYVNVWAWPAVQYVYRPSYVVYISPWGWRAHPAWYRPWRPVRWHAFHPYHAPYRHRYVVVHHHRVVRAQRVYTPVRTTSVTVRTRNQQSVNNYRATRTTKTVAVKSRGGQTKAVKRTTKVHGKQGTVKRSTHTRQRRN